MVRGTPPAGDPEGLSDLWFDTVQVYDAGDRVARDVRCLECHYNLRTLGRDARCPECGRTVAESIGVYASSPAEWLQSMADGAGLLAVSLGVIIVCNALMPACVALNSEFTAFLLVPVAGVWAVAALFGLLKLTARRPNMPPEQDDPPTRGAPRICVVLAIGSAVAALLTFGMMGLSLPRFGVGLLVVAGLAVLLLPIAICRHVSALMNRINRPDIAAFARLTLVAVAVLELLGVVDAVGVHPAIIPSSSVPWIALVAYFLLLLAMTILAACVCRASRHRAGELAAARNDSSSASAAAAGQEPPDTADESQ